MNSSNKASLSVAIGFLLWVIAWVAGWLLTSIKLVMPWLVGLGLVKWAAAIVSLVGLGIAFFWIFMFISIAIATLLGYREIEK